MVGGGTGIASLLEIGNLLHGKNNLHFLFGGRSAGDLFDMEQFSALGTVGVATNDGSQGHRGFVSDILVDWLGTRSAGDNPVYVLCGPEPMVEACFRILTPRAKSEDIWAAIEYMTSCGVGICGKCASPSGVLSCIDGPFMQAHWFQRRLRQQTCSGGTHEKSAECVPVAAG
jgi:dihydroorotate dehydrogenase (NAD+) catalytic subunit